MQATPTTDNPGPLIWVVCHNEAARDAGLLLGEAHRLQCLKPAPARSALISALCSGYQELKAEARHNAEFARYHGLLLFCWPGTKVLEGGAA